MAAGGLSLYAFGLKKEGIDNTVAQRNETGTEGGISQWLASIFTHKPIPVAFTSMATWRHLLKVTAFPILRNGLILVIQQRKEARTLFNVLTEPRGRVY